MWRGILKIVGQDHFNTSNVLNVAELNYMWLLNGNPNMLW